MGKKAKIARTSPYLFSVEVLNNEILKAMDRGLRTDLDISSQIIWKSSVRGWEQLGAFQKRVAFSETIAHLEHMCWQGQSRRIVKDGIVT